MSKLSLQVGYVKTTGRQQWRGRNLTAWQQYIYLLLVVFFFIAVGIAVYACPNSACLEFCQQASRACQGWAQAFSNWFSFSVATCTSPQSACLARQCGAAPTRRSGMPPRGASRRSGVHAVMTACIAPLAVGVWQIGMLTWSIGSTCRVLSRLGEVRAASASMP